MRPSLRIYTTLAISIFYLHINEVNGQTNPCPRLLLIEPNSPEPDRWYGTLTLISDADLSGVWLRIIFDRPSIQLGNWFGEVVTSDNKDYLIKNRNHQLKANTPTPLRFYIKFNPAEPIPNLMAFRLNAKTVCPEGAVTTPPPTPSGQLQTSGELSTTARPDVTPAPSFGGNGGGGGGGGGIDIVLPVSEEDDYFQGDFAIFSRPHRPPNNPSSEIQCGTIARRGRKKRQVNYQNYLNSLLNYLQMLRYSNYNGNGNDNNGRDKNYVRTNNTRAKAQPRPLITYGHATREGQFPWHAALYHTKGIDLAYICGASLISHLHVITVAHCVTRRKSQQSLSPENLIVYLGKYYLKRWSSPGIQDKQVAAIIPHPNYNSRLYSNDIAIIKLTTPAEFTDYVRPICLWENNVDFNTVVNKEGTVVGWGFDETGRVTEALAQAKMPVVSKETCIYSFPEFYSKFTTRKTYCAGFRNGTSVCNGDSGGGMVFLKENSPKHNPMFQLRGLVSISVALQNQFKCDSSHYVVFTDVAQYLDWIKATMSV